MHSGRHRKVPYTILTGWILYCQGIPQFFPLDFPGMFCNLLIAGTKVHRSLHVYSLKVSLKMKLRMCEPSFYRVLVSRDPIGAK